MGKFDVLFQNDSALAGVKTGRAAPGRDRSVSGLPAGMWVSGGVYRAETLHEIGGSPENGGIENPEEDNALREMGAGEHLSFLDIETTGLSGGTGTYAFLCGLGVVCGKYFKVVQFFLKNPAHEAEWLEAVDACIPEDATLVTYNGKTFDIPMLTTRHILSRMRPHWESSPHVDLLYFSRRFYRGYLESCSLGSVETNILGVRRANQDVPGYLIPEIYARYLRTGDAAPLQGVFYHNELDIASLASLYRRVSNALTGKAGRGREFLRAGDIWNDRGKTEAASRLWKMALREPESRAEASLRMAFAAKRGMEHENARIWFTEALREFSARGTSRHAAELFAILEELAKLEEHRFMRPERALTHVTAALDAMRRARHYGTAPDIVLAKALEHRRERLLKKIRALGDERSG
ncbi:MAG: ribonuclease H-like domain-containing protein [Synergistaceae bacterium]|jgi:uncharacterized protein YprB with RNaseH-like and TPR domain|nr:ribonuclease H-like domain-containing protein [Synergistaceae bacterium]